MDTTIDAELNEDLQITCHLPHLDPFDLSVQEYIVPPDPLNCSDKYPFLFATDLNNKLIQTANPKDFGWEHCCYKYIIRTDGDDDIYRLSKDCYSIEDEAIKIPSKHEFIAILCKNLEAPKNTTIVDVLSLVPIKPLRIKDETIIQSEDQLNVVVLGLDNLSHMNFIRLLTKSHSYLKNDLSAFAMEGFVKIGDNTFPNLVAVLTSLTETEVFPACAEKNDDFFDECPFIWKNFSDLGYATSFAEDAAMIGAFNYQKQGFKEVPVDYYIRPLTFFQEENIQSHHETNVDLCVGPRLTLDVLLDYVRKLAYQMHNTYKYFQFVWATALFHDTFTGGMHADEPVFETLKWLHKKNYLNNSVLIMMSDHGDRFDDIRLTYQGKIEERMPFLYFVLPDWFQKKYPEAAKNLKENQHKLTSPFDLHETLKDFLNPAKTLSANALQKATEYINSLADENVPRGISLFLPISPRRTCEMAGIDEHWCVCHKVQNLDLQKDTTIVNQAANTAVYFMNKLIEPYQQCALLSVSHILNAQVMEATSSILSNATDTNYGVTFVTVPGNGTFETTVNVNQDQVWTLMGDVSRINKYGNQSHCINNYKLKKICYCLEQL